MSPTTSTTAPARVETGATALAVWSVVAAFGAYFCMYAFRKPFTAATFSGGTVWGFGEKSALVTAQVLGYAASKVIGIRVIAGMRPGRRAAGVLLLIGGAEVALLLFGIAPAPWHLACLFLNGLSLGMVFGLVLGFLEGRRRTEALTAGLCASFILADGVTKSVGAWLLQAGVSERWMPAAAGAMFAGPLCFFVWMLTRVPPPNADDVLNRSERRPMDRTDRAAMLGSYGLGLAGVVAVYVTVTVVRSLRADFAPEIWRGLGVEAAPSAFTYSEVLVALGALAANGLSVLVIDNRRAFFGSLGVSMAGGLLMAVALVGLGQKWLDGFPFMVLIGLGLYLPYVAIHTTVFERLIAMTRGRGNLGFLMYVADAWGYLGYAALMIGKGFLPSQGLSLRFFVIVCWVASVLCCLSLAVAWRDFAKKAPGPLPVVPSS